MKNNVLFTCLIVLCCFVNFSCDNDDDNSSTNEGNIPDPVFEQALIDLGYDDILDGNLLISNVANVTELDISDTNFDDTSNDITNLSGIEYFTSLEILNCSGQSISSLDLSSNLNLRELDCSYSRFNSLTSVNVTQNTQLEILRCHANALTSIDVSNNANLKELYTYDNSTLTGLDVSNNPLLKVLWCYNNDITSIDISNNVEENQFGEFA